MRDRLDDRSASLRAAEQRISAVSRILDDVFTVPGTRYRVGVEPIVGLIPGAGDLVSGAVGAWIIIEATRFKLPGIVIARMILNTALDLVVGIVPLLGDAFDFVFKSNARNVALFRRYATDPDASTREHRVIILGVVLALVGLGWLIVSAVGWLLSLELPAP